MFFTAMAYAQGGAAPGAGGAANSLVNFLPIALIVVVFYFFIIRPQSKKAKEQRTFLDTLKRGDKVVTSSGILGTITVIDDSKGVVSLEVAKDTQIKIAKSHISGYQKVEETTK